MRLDQCHTCQVCECFNLSGWEEDPDTVYEVKKPLYGMPHSDRYLYKTWSQWLKSEGFESVGYEKSMWVKKDGDQQIMLCTHVDDSFVTASSESALRLCARSWLSGN